MSAAPYPPLLATPDKPYYPALTGLRAVAAWLIFFYHASPFDYDSLAGRIVNEFHVGVTLFFVLSGFLICLRYGNQIVLSRQWLGAYLYRRFARIYPLYFLLTCLLFTVYQLAPQYDIDKIYIVSHISGKLLEIVMNLTLLRSWFAEFKPTGIGTGWTLTVEEFFYLLAPFLILGLRHRLARLPIYTVSLLAIGSALVALPAPWHVFGFFASYKYMLSFTFFGRCFEFLGGVSLALLVASNASFLRRLSAHVGCTLAGALWIASCIGLLMAVRSLGWKSEWTDWGLIFLNNIVLVPGICLLLYGLLYEPSQPKRLLASQPFVLLGKASYALYLIHAGLLDRFLDLHVTTSLLPKFIIANALAIVLYIGVEYPLYKKLIPRSAAKPIAEG